LLIAGMSVYGLAAFMSEGFFHPDEHYQILEFADYKLGAIPAADLPWEFAAKMRPALQPALALGFIKIGHALGVVNPFTIAFGLRLLSGVLAILVYARFCQRIATGPRAAEQGKLLFFLAVVLWFVPVLAVRFSSENWSALAFLMGVSLLPLESAATDAGLLRLAGAGLLFGLAFDFRFQLVLAEAPIAVWVVLGSKRRWRDVTGAGLGACAGVVLGVLIDRWFYGTPVLTFWRYVEINVLQGKAAEFGVMPWWYYLTATLVSGVAPISVILLVLAGVGTWRQRRHALTWAVAAFVLGHSALGHKELRFLFPLILPVLWLVVCGWEYWQSRRLAPRTTAVLIRLSIPINAVAFVFFLIRPLNQAVPTWHYVYEATSVAPRVLYSDPPSLYLLSGDPAEFYRAPALTDRSVPNLDVVGTPAAPVAPGDLLLQRRLGPVPSVVGYRVEPVFRHIPSWMLWLNPTHWQERTPIWTVYQFARHS
jgi:phosphatidylinositol glycan class B